MKKRSIVSIAIIVVGTFLCSVLFLRAGPLPLKECSAEYLHYRDVGGIKASYVQQFPVNDTLSVAVTILQADDSAGWETLKNDFDIKPFPESFQNDVDRGLDRVSVRLVSKDNPAHTADTVDLRNNNVMATSRLLRSVCIFHTNSVEEQRAVKYSRLEMNLPQNRYNI